MGGDSSKLQFKDDGTKYNQFQKESSFTDSYYTTEIDETQFNEEQKKKAALIERQINDEKRGVRNNDHENDDEEMDTEGPSRTNVVNIMEIERNLSATSMDLQKQVKDVELMKKESQKSINDFEIEEIGTTPKIPIAKTEGKLELKPKMKIASREFTPKGPKPEQKSSTKSIDEFEITTGANTEKPEAPKSTLKLNKNTNRTFKPSGKSSSLLKNSKTSKPFKPSSNLSQSTAAPYRPSLAQPPTQTFPQPPQTPLPPPPAAAPKSFYPKGNE